MKTKYIILTIAILFSIGKPAQSQNDLGAQFAGFEATAREKYSNVSDDVKEGLRKYWLRQSDIQMWMNAKYEEEIGKIPIDYRHEKHESEMYGEYDWDNKALKLVGKTSEYTSHYGISVGSGTSGIPLQDVTNEAEIITQYTDKDGYWYVPYDDPNGEIEYIKFNAKQVATAGLEGLLDLDIEIAVNKLGMLVRYIEININWDRAELGGLLGTRLEDLIEDKNKSDEKIKEVLKVLYDEKMAETIGFPVFIHWALMYSPDYIKARETVSESKFDCNGIKNGCTKLTVTSYGENYKKSMKFDQYDRLTYINSLKEGTVRFAYDKDLTVKLPAATTLGSIIGGIEEKRKMESSEEAKKAAKEALEAAKREVERKKEIERLRNEELAKLEEQLKEAVTPKEREEIQQKIKELKELRENETNN